MKSKYKYLVLILITIIASIAIYNYIEQSTQVEIQEDILTTQNEKENAILANTNYTIEDPKIILDPYDVSPLTALVIFQTKDLSTATVTIKGKENESDITNTFLPAKTHILSIYGLYPDYENTVIISSSGEEKEIKIKTNPLPESIQNAKVETKNENTEFYFTTSKDGNPIAYDNNGQIRWFLNKKYTWNFTRLSNGHILLGNDNLISSPNYSIGLVEMDMLGKIYYEYNLPGGYHHDVFELSNGNLLVSSNNFEGGTLEDYIVEIDRNTGQIVKDIDLYDLLPKSQETNWFELNSLIYDKNSNSITMSGTNKDMIINIDYASEEINWIIAKDISKKYKKYLIKDDITNPSNLTLTTDGKIAFINTKDKNNYLTIYTIDNANKKIKETQNTNLKTKATNTNLDYDGNDFIISLDKKIYKNENTILTTNQNIYSVKYNNIYAGDVYTIGKGQRLGQIGTTETIKNQNIIPWTTNNEELKKYKLNIYKDANRLVVNGKFSKNDDVKIILDNVLDKKTYNVTISESPFINTNKKENINVTTYINEEGLQGKYYIYLKINNKTYKLNKYVQFY